MRAMRANTPMGRNLMMPEVRRIMASKSASKSSVMTRWGFSGNVVTVAPKTMLKKISASMSAVAAACMTFSGTMSMRSCAGDAGVSRSGSCCAVVSVISAPTPGWMTFTNSSPMDTAKRLERT
jgi:hypothetical protein